MFGVVEGIDAAHEKLQRAGCKHVGGAVPAYVAERMELVCYCRDGCGDDCAVLGFCQQCWAVKRIESD